MRAILKTVEESFALIGRAKLATEVPHGVIIINSLGDFQKWPQNPEVVGSSPASATIKTPDFATKSGVFSNFLSKNEDVKNPVGLAVGLVPKMPFSKNGENPTF